MIVEETSVPAPAGPLRAHVARLDDKPRPAVIVLEGVYGFDSEIKRITEQVANRGYVGIAIDYLRDSDPKASFDIDRATGDVAATRDWLNAKPYVQHGKIATWGFGLGGTTAFLAASLAGLASSIVFYGQSIARPLPGHDKRVIDEDVEVVRVPLLLVFGGHDEQIGPAEIATIREHLDARGKKYEIEVYPDVGHSFFREDLGTLATRQIADAWDRVIAFLKRTLA